MNRLIKIAIFLSAIAIILLVWLLQIVVKDFNYNNHQDKQLTISQKIFNQAQQYKKASQAYADSVIHYSGPNPKTSEWIFLAKRDDTLARVFADSARNELMK